MQARICLTECGLDNRGEEIRKGSVAQVMQLQVLNFLLSLCNLKKKV